MEEDFDGGTGAGVQVRHFGGQPFYVVDGVQRGLAASSAPWMIRPAWGALVLPAFTSGTFREMACDGSPGPQYCG